MMLYALICLSLSLTGIAGFQLAYMFYLDRLDRERKKRIRELEVQCRSLTRQLKEAEAQIEEQNDLLDEYLPDRDDEIWADVLDDR
jgi:hypothetical protein